MNGHQNGKGGILWWEYYFWGEFSIYIGLLTVCKCHFNKNNKVNAKKSSKLLVECSSMSHLDVCYLSSIATGIVNGGTLIATLALLQTLHHFAFNVKCCLLAAAILESQNPHWHQGVPLHESFSHCLQETGNVQPSENSDYQAFPINTRGFSSVHSLLPQYREWLALLENTDLGLT